MASRTERKVKAVQERLSFHDAGSFSPEENERLWLSGSPAMTAMKVIFVRGKKHNLAVPR